MQIPSRLEDSIGVAHLAKIVGLKPEFTRYSKELFTAGIAHYVGSPPFSHLGEAFLQKVLGVSHEQFAETMIFNSELSDELETQGIDINKVLMMINGQFKPISDVIAGSMDVDNLDNVQRYGKAMGIIQTPLYSGERLARSYILLNESMALEEGSEGDISGWLESRHRVYQYVFSAKNQVMGAMTRRALQFAYEEGELREEFFYWTDIQAYSYLLGDCNPKTRRIAQTAANKQPYTAVTDLVITKSENRFIQLCKDGDNREIVADSISEEFSIPREDVCVYFGKSRNYRSVHLPVINGTNNSNINGIQQEWTAQVFVNPEHHSKFDEIDNVFRSKTGISD